MKNDNNNNLNSVSMNPRELSGSELEMVSGGWNWGDDWGDDGYFRP